MRNANSAHSMKRRRLLGSIGVGCSIAMAGCLGFLEDGPDDTAEEFIEQLDDGEFGEANSLIHSDSTINGAGQAAEIIGAYYGVSGVVEALNISVEGSSVVNEQGDEATVAVDISVDLVVEEVQDTIELSLRQEDGEWRIWVIPE